MVGNYIVFLTFSLLIDPFSLSSSCHEGKNCPLSRSIFQLSGCPSFTPNSVFSGQSQSTYESHKSCSLAPHLYTYHIMLWMLSIHQKDKKTTIVSASYNNDAVTVFSMENCGHRQFYNSAPTWMHKPQYIFDASLSSKRKKCLEWDPDNLFLIGILLALGNKHSVL